MKDRGEREGERESKDDINWGRAMINLTLSSTNDDDDGKMNGNQPDDDFQQLDDDFGMSLLETNDVIKYDS